MVEQVLAVAVIALLQTSTTQVFADGNLQVKLISYSDAAKKIQSGACCSPSSFPPTGCDKSCNNYLLLCHKPYGDANACTNPLTTSTFQTPNGFGITHYNFLSSLGNGVSNPTDFKFTGRWPGNFRLDITAMNDGSATDDLITSIYLDQNPATLGSVWKRETLTVALASSLTHLILVLEWKVQCLPNYFDNCSNYCVPTNDSSGHYTCDSLGHKLCQSGYEDPNTNCTKQIDECASNSCQNGAACVDRLLGYDCICVMGFTGRLCEADTDECASNPCTHNGTCTDKVNDFACSCLPGYTGATCNIDHIDECASIPCRHNGTCTTGNNRYLCSCIHGYTGAECELKVNGCDPSPCKNGATCEDRFNGYTCSCQPGFTSLHCEVEIDECISSPCQNGGTCVQAVNTFTCLCATGFSGKRCESDSGVTEGISRTTVVVAAVIGLSRRDNLRDCYCFWHRCGEKTSF
ncbi:fibropellin-3-like isoform X2 [Oscarella lobularis]|uniref:fibropellin-3-like isoform X2 n=1 Tax=Oscarella lobularis TaxID=121494 RepID=UPI003313B756